MTEFFPKKPDFPERPDKDDRRAEFSIRDLHACSVDIEEVAYGLAGHAEVSFVADLIRLAARVEQHSIELQKVLESFRRKAGCA